MKISPLFLVGVLALCAPKDVLSAQCASRCGFLGLSTLQHFGNAGTNACVEYCLLFPRVTGLQCGGCTVPGSSPISIPIPAPTQKSAKPPARVSAPIPVRMPVPTPVKLPVPTPVKLPVPTPVTPPVPAPVKLPVPTPVTPPVPAPVKLPVPTPVTPPVPSPVKLPVPTPVVAPAPAPITPQNNYNIQMNLVGMPTSDQTFFTEAASKWQSIIVGDLENISSVGLAAPDLGCAYPSVIDDLYICGSFGTIDGSLNVLGYAGPTYIRSSDRLTIAGNMRFDIVDIDYMKSQNNFGPVILHEMGHVIGIGTLWVDKNVTGAASSMCPYRGAKANAEYEAISGCAVVPTENDGVAGDGTFCSHWDEQCMRSELMTGFVGAGISPLSRITIATAEDLGYAVSYASAESFNQSDLGSGCTCNRRSLSEVEESPASSHRNVRQLGLSDPSTKRRKLSDKGYATAVSFGEGVLAARKAKKPDSAPGSFGPVDSNTAVTYIGDSAVVVYVVDNGSVFDVVVRSD